LSIEGENMADPQGTRASTKVDGANIHAKNAISVAMEDLTEDDRKEIEQELEEERNRNKLVCFKKRETTSSRRWIQSQLLV
jgi:hypothetical protein